MGQARNASSGDKRSRWSLRQNTPKGAPVPGTGKRRYHKRKSGSNKSGSLSKLNLEWGATGRKQEDDQRGINNRARRQAIEDQIASNEPSEAELAEAVDAANCWDDITDWTRDEYEDIWERESQAYDDMWADDGDIYAGTYQGDL